MNFFPVHVKVSNKVFSREGNAVPDSFIMEICFRNIILLVLIMIIYIILRHSDTGGGDKSLTDRLTKVPAS